MLPVSIHYLLIVFAALALLGVIFEDVIHLDKAKVTLFFGTLSWLFLFIFQSGVDADAVKEQFSESLTEISQLWLFLIAAMTFVAYLNKKGMIQNMIYWILPRKMSERRLVYLTGIFCFCFSSLADNITATLVSVTLIMSLNLPRRKMIRLAALVVFAVNSGGVALITGDVTTLMIFLAGKVSVVDLLILSIPAGFSVLVLSMLLSRQMHGTIQLQYRPSAARGVDVAIAVIFLSTILLTIIGNAIYGIPPVLTFLAGLALMFLVSHAFDREKEEDPILDYIRLIEFDTLLFFLGVLLLVGMLKEIGVLNGLLTVYQILPVEWANLAMGIMSSVIDNVPLTAALLKSGIDMSEGQWLMLTYAVGVGGSLLIIGSAAGIVAMSKIGGLTFGRYLRQLIPLCFAYGIGYLGTMAVANWWIS
ncbi:sodium:proton antiporter [Idiomarina tyrosinivorans]|uniref:Sodium:proton antiporter n=1 Tax=Idiomarina tyrosinivorans TaxID=1445662 RepID=A0A432ZPH6_9GAMM|nr:sodium:proton antiporter NhaD [Idiomarina tyrosinivorans]RUO79761.1 sodium:proton antiporter [Idiomarina tyrosinivorans]